MHGIKSSEQYLKVVIHFEINSTTDAAKRNITFPSEKVIGEFWLNTVMRE